MLELGLLVGALLEELLDFEYLLRHLHHPEVIDFLGSLDGAPLQVLSQVDNHRVERQRKQNIFLQVVVYFLNHKTMLLRVVLGEH